MTQNAFFKKINKRSILCRCYKQTRTHMHAPAHTRVFLSVVLLFFQSIFVSSICPAIYCCLLRFCSIWGICIYIYIYCGIRILLLTLEVFKFCATLLHFLLAPVFFISLFFSQISWSSPSLISLLNSSFISLVTFSVFFWFPFILVPFLILQSPCFLSRSVFFPCDQCSAKHSYSSVSGLSYLMIISYVTASKLSLYLRQLN